VSVISVFDGVVRALFEGMAGLVWIDPQRGRACRRARGRYRVVTEDQDARPIHSSFTPADSRLIAKKIVASATRRGYAKTGQLTVFSTVSIS